jgi:hypothetical protein
MRSTEMLPSSWCFIRAITRDEARRIAANIALGVESNDVVNYTFPKNWPANREQGARIIGERLETEARFLA